MKRKFGFASAVTLAALFAASTASAATYYIDSGSTQGTEDGTAVNPFKTIENAFDGSPVLADGDIILVGAGTYNLAANVSFPNIASAITGVTLRGGYPGWSAGNFDATASDLEANPTLIHTGGYYLELRSVSTLENVSLTTTGNYAVRANGQAAIMRGLDVESGGDLFRLNSDRALLENSKVIETSCGLIFYNYNQFTLQDSRIENQSSCGGDILYNDNAKAVLRRNEFYSHSANIVNGGGNLIAYQNLFSGFDPSNVNADAFNADDSNTYWVVKNNNFTLLEQVVDSELEWNYGSWSYNSSGNMAYMEFENNALFNNGEYDYGYFTVDEHPYSAFYARNNCMDRGISPTIAYLYSYQGFYAYPNSVQDLEELMPGNFSGNQALLQAPENPKSSVCNGKGITTTAMLTKPVAKAYAYDTTYSSYFPHLGVGRGGEFYLRGEASINFEPGELTYTWTKTSGPNITLYSSAAPGGTLNSATGEEVTAATMAPGTYTFMLVVRNKNAGADNVASDPAYVTVTVQSPVVVYRGNGTVRGSFSYLQAAVAAAMPGDTVQLPAGIFFINDWNSPGGTVYAAQIYGKSDITIQGAGNTMAGTVLVVRDDDAFDIQYSTRITIRDLAFVDADDDGYYLADAAYSGQLSFDRVAVLGWDVDPDYGYGIYTNYADVKVTNSRFEWTTDGLEFDSCGDYHIEGNTFIAMEDETIDTYAYCDDYGSPELLIRNNMLDMKTSSDYGIYVDDWYSHGKTAIIEGNTVKNLYGYGMYLEDMYYGRTIVRDNILYNNRKWNDTGYEGIYVYYGIVEILNNVVWGFYDSLIYNEYGNIYVEGNVLAYSEYYYGIENYSIECHYVSSYQQNCTLLATAKNNVVFGNYEGEFYNVNVLEGNVTTDPGFVNADLGNFALTASSPLHTMGLVGANAKPGMPTNVAGTALPGAVELTFDAVEGATSYTVFWGESALALSQSLAIGAERYALVTDLAAMPYYFAVAAVNANGQGAVSPAIIVKPMPAAVSAQSQPVVEGVFPHKILVGQVLDLEISGADFVAGAKVLVGGTELEVVEVTDNMIKATTNKDIRYGVHPVVVLNPDLGRGSLAQAIIVSRTGSDDDAGCASAGTSGAMGMVLPMALLALVSWARRRRA